jgi:hypothetical protein
VPARARAAQTTNTTMQQQTEFKHPSITTLLTGSLHTEVRHLSYKSNAGLCVPVATTNSHKKVDILVTALERQWNVPTQLLSEGG